MIKTILTSVIMFSVGLTFANGSINQETAKQKGDMAQAKQFMHSHQSTFEENKGQVTGVDASKVKYFFKDKDLSIFLLNDGLAYQFNRTHYPDGYKNIDKFATPEEMEKMEALQKDIRIESYRMDVRLIGANLNARITAEGKSQDYVQYYNQNALDVHSYSKITYHNVYPNIDWVIYKTSTQLKYDFIVRPGGNPNQIKLQTFWVEDLKLNKDGSLTFRNHMGSITEQTPVSLQEEKEIETAFKLENDVITFNLQNYNPDKPLTIDPSLIWATYYGGDNYDDGWSCEVDGSGNVYVAGRTGSSTNIASGGHQNTSGGHFEPFLVKFNASGTR